MGVITVFQRVEKKYRLTLEERDRLLEDIGEYLEPDEYGKSTVCSLYLDTPHRLLIRQSIDAKGFDKPAYKEKLRMRSYGTPNDDTKVFLEIKKKFKGVVYKRRVRVPLSKAKIYLNGGEKPMESQIMNEIDWALHYYGNVGPAMLIACEREAFSVKDNPQLRLTFDTGIRYRDYDLDLALGHHGTKLLPDDIVLMEVKTGGAMPLWLAHALDKHKIFPTSFSKYGTAHLRTLKK